MEHSQKIHFSQVKKYLKTIHYRLGILIDFGGVILEFKRNNSLIFSVDSVSFQCLISYLSVNKSA